MRVTARVNSASASARAALLADEGEVVQGGGQLGMMVAQSVFFDGERSPVEGLGLGQFAPAVRDRGEVVQADRYLVVASAVGAFEGGQGVAQERFGFGGLAEGVQDRGEGGLVGRDGQVVGAGLGSRAVR